MSNDELEKGEYHPAADTAAKYVIDWLAKPENIIIRESLASCAIKDNRLCRILLGTLDRMEKNEPVSDRYLLGLAWFLRFELETVINAE